MKWYVLFTVSMLALSGTLVSFFLALHRTPPTPPEAIAALKKCLTDPDTVLACGTMQVQSLLTLLDPGETMDVLSTSLDPFACHTIGHIVGQQSYLQYRDVDRAISKCSEACDNSCLHGVVDQAIVEETDIEVSEDGVVHLNLPLIQAESEKLCARNSMCHGVGHILFQVFNDLQPALTQCDTSASGSQREFCYWGVFMENADVISTDNIILGTKRNQSWDALDPFFPCATIEERYRHACYRYQPRIQNRIWNTTAITDEIWKKRTELCATLTGPDRSSCFEGAGFGRYQELIKNPQVLHNACGRLPRTSDRAACIMGAVYPISRFDRAQNAFEFCATTVGSVERSICYHAVFESIAISAMSKGVPMMATPALLAFRCMQYGEKGCQRELRAYLEDPWQTVFGMPDSIRAYDSGEAKPVTTANTE